MIFFSEESGGDISAAGQNQPLTVGDISGILGDKRCEAAFFYIGCIILCF